MKTRAPTSSRPAATAVIRVEARRFCSETPPACGSAVTRPPRLDRRSLTPRPSRREDGLHSLVGLLVGRLGNDRRRPLEAPQRGLQWLRAQGPLAIGQVLRLVAVRVREVREVDVKGCAGLEDAV